MIRFLRVTGVLSACLAFARAEEAVPTVITSDSAEVVSTDTQTTFSYRNNVVVTGTNLKLTCDQLVVIANRTGDTTATLGNQDKFKSLVAKGHVHMIQSEREVTCDLAEVLPGENKAILSGHLIASALDKSWVQTGERGTLYRGERRIVIEGSEDARPTTTLPALKDLGYDKDAEKNAPAPGTPAASPATAPTK